MHVYKILVDFLNIHNAFYHKVYKPKCFTNLQSSNFKTKFNYFIQPWHTSDLSHAFHHRLFIYTFVLCALFIVCPPSDVLHGG